MLFRLSTVPYGSRPPRNGLNEYEMVTVLASMLNKLKRDAEEQLLRKIMSAALTIPFLNGMGYNIGERIIRNAFERVNLEYIPIHIYRYIGDPLTYIEDSQLAAHNLGLCQPYTVPNQNCADLTRTSYMLVGFYPDGLEITKTADRAIAYHPISYIFKDYSLGSNMATRNPDESYYWEQVRDFANFAVAGYSHRNPRHGKLIFYGSSSGDERLRKLVDQALRRFLDEDEMPELVNDEIDPVYAGAFGSAEFAKRAPFCEWCLMSEVNAHGERQQQLGKYTEERVVHPRVA